MIPHKIQIKNFLSYGSDLQEIDFSPYHLIYLSGKNGHGKSALLDAMTWALWGQARKITNAVKPDQGLLRLGQTHMIVIFDFELNGQMYRVRREFEKKQNKATAYLEFGMLNDATDELIPLTDKTTRLTQAVIEKTIRLDYESFVNSAFLRQGHANEFSQKSPKDRKDILGTILGLQQFDLLKRRAMDRAKDAIAQRQALLSVHDMIAQQLNNQKEIENQLKTVGVQLADMGKKERVHNDEQTVLAKQRAEFVEKQKAYDLLQFKKQQHSIALQKQMEQLREDVRRWRSIHKKQLSLPNYQELEKQKKDGSAQLERCQKTLQNRLLVQGKILKQTAELQQQRLVVQKQYVQLFQTVQLQQERFRHEKKTILVSQEQLVKQKKEQDQYLAQQEKECAVIQEQSWEEKKLQAIEAQFEKRKNVYQQFLAKGNWLKTEHDTIQQKHELAHDDNPSCPMCEQNLSASRRKFLRNKFEKQQTLVTHQLARLSRVVSRLKQLLVDQHKKLARQKELQSECETIDKETKRVQEQLKDNEKQETLLVEQLKTVDAQLADVQKECVKQQAQEQDAIAKDATCQTLQKELLDFEKTLNELRYDEQEHKNMQKKLQTIEQQIADYVHVQHEIHNQKELSKTISSLIVLLKQQKQEQIQYQKDSEIYASLGKEGQELLRKEKEIGSQYRALLSQKETLLERQGSLKSTCEQLAKLKNETEKQQLQIKKLNEEIDDYQTIAAAVGKDGIQALLIEEAIPEIEQEANFLLAKLTNNQSQIFIESLRDLKRGGSKETLDVNIADPSGVRPYELFSGGEAFRIDFALRIAISKLLARRAGTALQTLIIDEGFGSQDEEGLSHIMDAIYKVQDDFEKVIIVSHLPSMRDQFPVHFMVQKGMNGSCVQVIQQG